jgi:hypothetical protein
MSESTYTQEFLNTHPIRAGALRTLRLSATGGTRTIGSMIASSYGGAGSPIRVYKFISNQNKSLSPSGYFFDYLGGNRNKTAQFNTFYMNFNSR